MKNNSRIVNNNQAEKLLRFINFIIDYILINLSLYGFGMLIGTLYYATGSEFLYNIILSFDNRIVEWLISVVLLVGYYIAFEYFTNGRTIGKFITGTVVVKNDGSVPTFNDIFKRSFSRIVPFDALSFLGSNGWHDSWSDTKVVKRKSYLEAVERENSIEEIGIMAQA